MLASTVLVTVGVVVEFAELLLFNREMQPLQRRILFVGAALVIVGCAGEFWFEKQAGDLEGQLQQASDVKVAALARDEAADNKIAKQAAQSAAALGVKVDTLPSFVASKEGQITGQITKFQSFAITEKARADAVSAELNRDRTDLVQARTEAQAAAKKAESELAVMNAANTPRGMTLNQQIDFAERMKAFSGLTANVFTPPSTTPDAGPLADLLGTLLTKANWKVGPFVPIGGWAKYVLVCVGKNPKTNVEAAAQTIVLALRSYGIQAFIDPDLGPDIPASGSGNLLSNPDMTIIIGAKQ